MAVDSTFANAIESARAKIAGTIKQAASATGASFEYLISAAKIESNLDPRASASTSSARGLYQFIEQTWLGTVKEAGGAFGFGKFSSPITFFLAAIFGLLLFLTLGRRKPGLLERVANMSTEPLDRYACFSGPSILMA